MILFIYLYDKVGTVLFHSNCAKKSHRYLYEKVGTVLSTKIDEFDDIIHLFV